MNEKDPRSHFHTQANYLPAAVLPMKTTSNVLLTAIVAAVTVKPHGVSAVERRLLPEYERRQLLHTDAAGSRYVHGLGGAAESKEVEVLTFPECVGKTKNECLAVIVAIVDGLNLPHGELLTDLEHARVQNDADYYLVGLRTNLAETHVTGILGDGLVFYPFDWCTTAGGCAPIGPWDCDMGTLLTTTACCAMIKASVPTVDVHGNYLDCYIDPPFGSVSEPIDLDTITMVVDGQNKVVHPVKHYMLY